MSLTVLAHQGGWDEALLVTSPILLFAGLVWHAKRRAVRQAQGDTDAESPVAGDQAPGDDG